MFKLKFETFWLDVHATECAKHKHVAFMNTMRPIRSDQPTNREVKYFYFSYKQHKCYLSEFRACVHLCLVNSILTFNVHLYCMDLKYDRFL